MNSDVTIIVSTLNDMHRDLDFFFFNLVENNPAEIIVADGGSQDGTIDIAKKYTNSVYVVSPGMATQHYFALKKVKTKYVICLSTKNVLPSGLVSLLKKDFESNDCFAILAKQTCRYERNFIEKGKKIMLEFLQEGKKNIDVPTDPCFYNTEKYLNNIVEELVSSHNAQDYSVDTIKADLIKEKNLKVLYSQHYSILNEKLNFKKYVKKTIFYGQGDLSYYIENKNRWTNYRKILSLTHVLRRYIVVFPLKCILKPRYLIAIPFFWLTATLRYYGFFKSIFKKIILQNKMTKNN